MSIVSESVSRGVGRQILTMKANSPHIFFALGVAGTIASTVLACRATLKLNDTLDEIKKDVDNVNGLKEDIEKNEAVEYPVEQIHHDTVYVYAKAGVKIAKLYAPAAVVGALSIGALTGSHIQMTRRNTALMAAYATLQKAYDEYRQRIRDEYGDEQELDVYHAAKTETVQNEDGKELDIKLADPSKWSPYAKFFDEASSHWKKDSELNWLFIRCQERWANDKLRTQGHIFLNEVYDMLDIPRTRAGSVVGWIWQGDGDNYISFGIYEAYNSNFVNGNERNVLLDFNVDGVIFDKI